MSDAAALTADLSSTATYREIIQQPDVWRETARIVGAQRPTLDDFLAPLLRREDLRVVLTGAGTSAFIGQIAAPSLGARLGRRVEAVATTDLVSHPGAYLPQDVPTLLVSFARSGDSPESTAATELADRFLGEVSHLIITCNPEGALNRAHKARPGSFVLLMPERSHDDGFAMTSSFTSMLLAVLLAFRGDDDVSVDALAGAAEQLLAQRTRIAALADCVPQRLVYLGGGPLAGLAREAALKTLELTAGRVVAYHDSSLGFRHGPKAVLNAHSLAVVFRSADPYSGAYDEDIVEELRGTLGRSRVLTVSVGQAGGPQSASASADWTLAGLEALDDAYLAVVYIVFAQLFALYCSAALGLTPDNPFPRGDVNRVVKGVTIHPLIDAPAPDCAAERRP
ncbi:SIS domain-containing protein [Actinospica sp. MGRD01-02]|uniref:SIS domain-containing protein n=1 Tax=Actinospica acidithermotolerans TaxID=2828514 RepID=A0A941IEE5_9ACTN|nr:SIS domain-containing protein [Actinospica acidithermotolerans]MBR7825135.1 SIS domain-containing protein [Actinospica acidithermotolerans]